MTSSHDVLRKAVLASLAEIDAAPDAQRLYLPYSHVKALHPDTLIVAGAAGMGKSFLCTVMQSDALRRSLPYIDTISCVQLGFASHEDPSRYPHAEEFSRFMDQGGDPYDLWRAVILRLVASQSKHPIASQDWPAIVQWMKSRPEDASRLMQSSGNSRTLIVFDALDRISNTWQRMDDIVRGLLRAVLWLRTFPNLRGKVFLREDQITHNLFNFPDASKLFAARVDLVWKEHDFHRLLWNHFLSAPHPHEQALRELSPYAQRNDDSRAQVDIKKEIQAQRKAFEVLSGPQMEQRVSPYNWIFNQLADGRGRISPRSFLVAIHKAAEYSSNLPSSHALHTQGIRQGVRKACEVRMEEIARNYPWVPAMLGGLRYVLAVPCTAEALVTRCWQKRFPDGPQSLSTPGLPPRHAANGWNGWLEDLQQLGLIRTRKNGLIDLPKVYRAWMDQEPETDEKRQKVSSSDTAPRVLRP